MFMIEIEIEHVAHFEVSPCFVLFSSPPIKGFSATQIEAPRREVDTCSSSVDLSVGEEKM